MQLLLPSARSGVMIEIPERHLHPARTVLAAFGIVVVLWGFLDLASRVPGVGIDNETLRRAFEPAIMLD